MTKFGLVHLLCVAWFAISGFAYAETGVPAEIKIQDTVCTTGAEKFGEISCDTLKKESGKLLKDAAKHVIASYRDDGVILQFSSKNGFCKTTKGTDNTVVEVKHPFCNIMDGEVGVGRCGGSYCQFSKDDGFKGSSSCLVENSYFLGSRVEIWKKAYEEVAADLQNGTIKVHSIGGARPCGAYAKAIVAVLNGDKGSVPPKAGLRDVRTALSKKYAPTEKRINSSELSKSCLGDQGEMMDPTKIGDKTKMTQHRSLAFCHLVSAHVRMRGLFHNLLRCEFSTRADEKFNDLADQTFIMNPAMSLIEQCNDGSYLRDHESRDQDGNVTRRWRQVDDKDGALRSFERCYRKDIDDVIRKAIHSKIPVSNGDALKPYAKIQTKDGENYPACSGDRPLNLSGLMLIPFLRRRKRGAPHVLTKLLLLALVFTFTTAFGRKRDDHGTVDSKVCADGKTIERVDYAQIDGVERTGSSDPDSPYEQNKSECGAYYDSYYRGCAQKFFSWFCGRNKHWKQYQNCISGEIGQAIVNTRLGEACPCGGGGDRSECDTQAETPPPSNVLSSPTFADLQNAQALAADSEVIMPPEKPDSESASSGAPSESAATEGGPFDDSLSKEGTLADMGGSMDAPKFDMADTTGEGAEGAADASGTGGSGARAAADDGEEESALTAGEKSEERLAYEGAGKGAGKQGSPFTGSRFGSDFESSGKGASDVNFSRDPAGAAAGGGAGEEDPETYLARAGTDSLFERVHPHFSRWGDRLQAAKWKSELKRLGK